MTMSKQEFLQSAGIDTQTVEFWLEQQWLLPEPTPAGPSFSDRDRFLFRNALPSCRT